MFLILIALAAAVVVGWWLFRLGSRSLAGSGLPRGEVIYIDTGAWQKQEQPLISREFGLVGKPDYLVETGHGAPVALSLLQISEPTRPD